MLTSPKSYSKSATLGTVDRRITGFTLVELIMVMAIIAILAAMIFGISSGVTNARNKAKAKVELVAIAQALEQFKSRFGDYPWHDSADGDYPVPELINPDAKVEVTNTMLLYALTGRMKMERQSDGSMLVEKISDDFDDTDVAYNPTFLDISKFYTDLDDLDSEDDSPQHLLDPWGNPYIYWYKWEDAENEGSGPVWDVFGYHLYSTGPNGDDANTEIKTMIDPDTGELDKDFRSVADAEGIIFSGE